MFYISVFLGVITFSSFIFGVWQYFRLERIKELNSRTLIQIWNEAKRLLKLSEQGSTTEHNKALMEVARTIENMLLKAVYDTYRPTDSKIDKWAFEGKITSDEARRLKGYSYSK